MKAFAVIVECDRSMEPKPSPIQKSPYGAMMTLQEAFSGGSRKNTRNIIVLAKGLVEASKKAVKGVKIKEGEELLGIVKLKDFEVYE